MNNSRDTFKKVYVEITNICNLNCPFCLKTKRDKKNMSFDEFKLALDKIKPYTKYIYLHILGEPLMHPEVNKFIDYASKDFNVNITTNGYLINKLNSKNIRQINISLHSYSDSYTKSLEEYLNDIYNFTIKNKKTTYINYRLWVDSDFSGRIIGFLEGKFFKKIIPNQNNKLDDNVFLSFGKEFIWPDNGSKLNNEGKCYALKDHIGLLSNGEIVPCCLDGNGSLSFGNIFKDDLSQIIKSERFNKMKNELQNEIRNCDLCKKCNHKFVL